MSVSKSTAIQKLAEFDENIRVREFKSITGTIKVVLTNIETRYRSFMYQGKTSIDGGINTKEAVNQLAQEYIMRNDLSQHEHFKVTRY